MPNEIQTQPKPFDHNYNVKIQVVELENSDSTIKRVAFKIKAFDTFANKKHRASCFRNTVFLFRNLFGFSFDKRPKEDDYLTGYA